MLHRRLQPRPRVPAATAPQGMVGTTDGRVFSLRSTEEGLDVSEIAKQYGGGGHKHASGFRVPYGHELTK